jgi:hypothetical protein
MRGDPPRHVHLAHMGRQVLRRRECRAARPAHAVALVQPTSDVAPQHKREPRTGAAHIRDPIVRRDTKRNRRVCQGRRWRSGRAMP